MDTSLIKVPEKDIQILLSTASSYLEKAEKLIVTNEDEASEASIVMAKIGLTIKEVEGKRTSFTAPINDIIREFNSNFKKVSEPMENAKKMIGDKIMAWKRAENEKIAKEEARRQAIQKAHEDAGHKISEPIELARVEKKIGFSQTRKIWKFKIVDFTQIPDEYKEIATVVVNDAIRKGIREIKGISIYEEEVIATSMR